MTSASSSVWIKLIPFSSHVLSIISDEFLWDDISSLILFISMISSLIIIIDYVSVSFLKVTSVLTELLVWMLIRGRFEFPITFSLFDVFKWFDLLLLTCELTLVHILLLEIYETSLPCFLLDKKNTITTDLIL